MRAALAPLIALLAGVSLLAACGGGGGGSSSSVAPSSSVIMAATPTPAPTPSPAVPSAQTPRASDAFVDAAGINVHLNYGATIYATQFPLIATRLESLGVRHIRDGITLGQPQLCTEAQQLVAAGIHLDVISAPSVSAADLAAYAACVSPAIEAIEGPSEYDVSNDPNWAQTIDAYQPVLYAAAKTLGTLPVISPAFTSAANYTAVGSLRASTDDANMHDYFAGHNPGTAGWGGTDAFGAYGALTWNINVALQPSGTKPVMSTETGYSDALDIDAVSAAVKEHYLLRTLLEQWNAGIVRTYLYELVDEGATPYSHFGLLDASGNPKPAFTAVQGLLAHVADPGTAPTLVPLSLGIGGAASIHHVLLQKRNGTYVLALWNEVSEWNVDQQTAIATAPLPVTLSFATAPSAIATTTFDDASGTATTQTHATGTVIGVSISGNPTLVDITR